MSLSRACLILLLPLSAFGQAKKEPPKEVMSDAEKRVRAVVDLKFGYKDYVITEGELPPAAFEQPEKAKEVLGRYTIKQFAFDQTPAPPENAKPTYAPPRAIHVQVIPETGPSYRRFFTIFRTRKPVDAGWKFTPDTAKELADWAGVDPNVVKVQQPIIAEVLRDRTFADFKKDPRAARLLAGLTLIDPKSTTYRKNTDALAQERNRWVILKRQLNGSDKEFPKPVVAPDRIEGKPALVVREGTAAEAGMKPDAAAKLDAVLTDWAKEDEEAFAVCIVRKGVIVLHKAYGTRDGKPMTTDTKSWMASITKPMSCSCMMMLVDRSLVGLDEPIDKYLPALRGIKVAKPLTVRHLYTHTAGLSKWPGEWYQDELPDIEERVALAYPHLQVGKEWAYNGQSYTLGGKIIETVSGEALPLFFFHHLLTPLGMEHTDITGTHADARSTPLDIARFGQMLLNKGAYGDKRFFKEETFAKMLPKKLTDVLGPDTQKTFGLGLDGSAEKIGHGAASGATFHIDRTEELIIVQTRNKYTKAQEKWGGKFHEAIRNGIEKK
jgi:CubicO group peptidase (beta-lactamase class C family)